MSAIRKAFDRMMVDVLSRPGELKPDLKRVNPNYVAQLQQEGYIDVEYQMTEAAFLLYFERFEKLQCPPSVQLWVDNLNIGEIQWRRAAGIIQACLQQNRGCAYAPFRTIFIGDESDDRTWYHELGHVCYYLKIVAPDKARLATEARKQLQFLHSHEITNAADPVTGQPIRLPDGMYIVINKRYCGLDHSGSDEDVQNDEIWAHLFAEYCCSREMPETVVAIMDSMLAEIKDRPPDKT